MVGFISCHLRYWELIHRSTQNFRDALTSNNPGWDSDPPPKRKWATWRRTPMASGLHLYHLRPGNDRICSERKVYGDDMDRFAGRTGRASCFDPR